jgi:very-short-patch-repair endonuclease
MTGPERRLWYALRDRRLAGFKFRRQVVIGPFIVDFYHHDAGLVIEIDGESHADRGEADRERQAWLESRKLRVLRFTNDDILHDLENVLVAIASALNRPPAS